MKKLVSIFCFFLLSNNSPIEAAYIGNPSQPYMQKTGLIKESPSNWSFRLSYFGDYVYKQSFHDEVYVTESANQISSSQFWTQAGMLTFNMANRVDVYGILGGTRMDGFDTKTPQDISWGAGVKVNFYHYRKFRLGCDFKYFACYLYPKYIEQNKLAYNLITDLMYDYYELQGAVGLSFLTRYVSPYINGTYLHAKLSPQPNEFVMKSPTRNKKISGEISSSINSNHFGIALGISLLDLRKASLNLEWRAINQNAINLNGEIRF